MNSSFRAKIYNKIKSNDRFQIDALCLYRETGMGLLSHSLFIRNEFGHFKTDLRHSYTLDINYVELHMWNALRSEPAPRYGQHLVVSGPSLGWGEQSPELALCTQHHRDAEFIIAMAR